MTNIMIKVENLGKKYNINHQKGGYVALRDVITNIFKSPFAFAKKRAKEIAGIDGKEEFWALSGINFTVAKGEVIGIIGSNGAGKSTLLKILSQITPPTTGEIKIKGRVGSLLEVGTGFHPELTGRENIMLNGAILGMSYKEVAEKFDQIVEFSGIEKFLDTPVKYYSSGMYVRLAFSVAAHMEPDILIVDEVLAVGDAEFQKKCLGKMDEITKQDGRTILFVSHNMGAVRQLCKKTILIEAGKVKMIGETKEVTEAYLMGITSESKDSLEHRQDRTGTGDVRIRNLVLADRNGKEISVLESGAYGEIWIGFDVKNNDVRELEVVLAIYSLSDQNYLACISTEVVGKPFMIKKDSRFAKFAIQKVPFNAGEYQVSIFLRDRQRTFDSIPRAKVFGVTAGNFYTSSQLPDNGPMLVDYDVKE